MSSAKNGRARESTGSSGKPKRRMVFNYGRRTKERGEREPGAGFAEGVLFGGYNRFYDPRDALHELVREVGDPARAPGKVKTLKDMTEAEKAEMERLYGGGLEKKR